MNPHSGEIGGQKYRISEDDAAGLMQHHPGSSTGVNLMLGKYKPSSTPGTSRELWRTGTVAYSKSAAAWSGAPPAKVRAMHTGPGSTSTRVEWRASPTATCAPGVGYLVGNSFPTMVTNTPFPMQPNSWDFSAVPVGSYRLCVSIDPYNTVGETSDSDNTVGSLFGGFVEVKQ